MRTRTGDRARMKIRTGTKGENKEMNQGHRSKDENKDRNQE
jgi:hypothetical protein